MPEQVVDAGAVDVVVTEDDMDEEEVDAVVAVPGRHWEKSMQVHGRSQRLRLHDNRRNGEKALHAFKYVQTDPETQVVARARKIVLN